MVLSVLWLVLLLLPMNCWASNPSQGARAAAMGTAFVAIADDPSAILHNPAGLTSLKGTHTYGGGTALTILSSYEDPHGQEERTHFQVFFPPHMFVSTDFGLEDVAFGLGLYSPFGIGGRRWDQDGLTRYVSTESVVGTFVINPTFAWRPLPALSLGFGVDYLYAIGKAKRKIDQSALGAPDGSFEFKESGGGWGFNLGVLYAISDRWSMGAAYRSRIVARERGTVTLGDIAPPLQPLFGGDHFKTDARTTLRFPDDVNAGVAFRPTEKWTLGFEVEWQDWSRFSKSDLDLKTEVPAAGFTDVSVDATWGSAWLIKLGVEYAVSPHLSVRGGYVYYRNPVPDRTLAPDNPDSDQHNLAVGIGYKTGRLVIDAFYNAGFNVDRSASNPFLSGTYGTAIHSLGFSIGYRFGEESRGNSTPQEMTNPQ